MTLPSPTDEGIRAEDLGHVLFIGVGGVGLSGLARLYATRGIQVTGSELHDWPSLADLESLGVVVHREHKASNLDGIDTVVRSTVHPDDHVELVEARRRGLRIYHRSEALAAAMTDKRSIAVTGTHGKTTTTAVLTELLAYGGLEPSYVNGGASSATGYSGGHGDGEFIVIEADESDRSFFRYRPEIAILTNIDADHLNNYGSMAELEEGFTTFLDGVSDDGFCVICADDPRVAKIGRDMQQRGKRVISYGVSPQADFRVQGLASDRDGVSFTAEFRGEQLGQFTMPVPGAHLGLNSAAAIVTALELGMSATQLRDGLAAFSGVKRRFEHVGTVNDIKVYDEYAYHPTAMTAALETLKTVAGNGRLLVVFQPYRVYRTLGQREEIAAALAIADMAVVMEIFAPGEDLPVGDAGEALCRVVDLPEENKRFSPEWDDVPEAVRTLARPGDVVVTMGAPPVSMMPAQLLAALKT